MIGGLCFNQLYVVCWKNFLTLVGDGRSRYSDDHMFMRVIWLLSTSSDFLHAAAGLMFVSVTLALYCIVWLAMIKKIERYERKHPWIIPVVTITGIASWIW